MTNSLVPNNALSWHPDLFPATNPRNLQVGKQWREEHLLKLVKAVQKVEHDRQCIRMNSQIKVSVFGDEKWEQIAEMIPFFVFVEVSNCNGPIRYQDFADVCKRKFCEICEFFNNFFVNCERNHCLTASLMSELAEYSIGFPEQNYFFKTGPQAKYIKTDQETEAMAGATMAESSTGFHELQTHLSNIHILPRLAERNKANRGSKLQENCASSEGSPEQPQDSTTGGYAIKQIDTDHQGTSKLLSRDATRTTEVECSSRDRGRSREVSHMSTPLEDQLDSQHSTPLDAQLESDHFTPSDDQLESYHSTPLGDRLDFHHSTPLDDQLESYHSAPLDDRLDFYHSTPTDNQLESYHSTPLDDRLDFHDSTPSDDQLDSLALTKSGRPESNARKETGTWERQQDEFFNENSSNFKAAVFVKRMAKSQVVKNFLLRVPAQFCKKHLAVYLPEKRVPFVLVDEQLVKWKVQYLPHTQCISGGWGAFAKKHTLQVDDIVKFRLIERNTFQVTIKKEAGDLATNCGPLHTDRPHGPKIY